MFDDDPGDGDPAQVLFRAMSDDTAALRALLATQRIAALATLHRGAPAVSMVPFALLAASNPKGDGARFVVHVSALATHTADMLAQPSVALLVAATAEAAASPLALPRVSIAGVARPCPPDDGDYAAARAAYLERIPESEPLFSFGDFSLFLIEARSARWVAGFGRATSLTASKLAAILRAEL